MTIVRASEQPIDRSDPGVSALRLVTRKTGAKTMVAGVATFAPGSRILLHTHPCEETVIVLQGKGVAYVNGQAYQLEQYDTTIMPPLTPHYFANESDAPMVMAYFYPDINVARDPV